MRNQKTIIAVLLGILLTGTLLLANDPPKLQRSPSLKRSPSLQASSVPIEVDLFLKRGFFDSLPTVPNEGEDDLEKRVKELEAKLADLNKPKAQKSATKLVKRITGYEPDCINGVCYGMKPVYETVEVPINSTADLAGSTAGEIVGSVATTTTYSTVTSTGCNCPNCQCNSLAANAHLFGDRRLAAKTRRRNLMDAWVNRPGLFGWRLRWFR